MCNRRGPPLSRAPSLSRRQCVSSDGAAWERHCWLEVFHHFGLLALGFRLKLGGICERAKDCGISHGLMRGHGAGPLCKHVRSSTAGSWPHKPSVTRTRADLPACLQAHDAGQHDGASTAAGARVCAPSIIGAVRVLVNLALKAPCMPASVPGPTDICGGMFFSPPQARDLSSSASSGGL